MDTHIFALFAGHSIYGPGPLVRFRLPAGPELAKLARLEPRQLADVLPPGDAISTVRTALRDFAPPPGIPWFCEALGLLGVALQEDHFAAPLGHRVRETGTGYEILMEVHEPRLGWLALGAAYAAVRCAAELTAGRPVETVRRDIAALLLQFAQGRSRARLDENTRQLVEAAKLRGIPVMQLLQDAPLIQLGQGCRRVRILQAHADTTSGIATRNVAPDKMYTANLLREALISVPEQIAAVIPDREQTTVVNVAALNRAIEKFGFPLVVKGRRGDKGATVTTGIGTAEDLRQAVEDLAATGVVPIIEPHIPGDDHRITVIGGRMIAAARRTAAQVVGDGIHNIRELINSENERRRKSPNGYWLVPLTLDQQSTDMLNRAGLKMDSVPEAGQRVLLRQAGNLSLGGTSEDVTDVVHPAVKDAAERAALTVGLDIAGLDIITPDITKPLVETGGVILEVNNFPGLRPHYVTSTPPRDVAGAVIDHLFPNGSDGRIPTCAVTGTNGKTTVCRMLSTILQKAGRTVGMSTSNEVVLAGRTVLETDAAGGKYARVILADPRIDAGVFEMARGAMIRAGMQIDECTVGVVTNVTDDHIGLAGIETVEDMARVKRTVADAASGAAVLNADDPHCRAMAEGLRAPVWWFTADGETAPPVPNGGAVVKLDMERGAPHLVVERASGVDDILPLSAIPSTFDGHASFNVENAAAAAAAALALNLPLADVRAGLAEFDTDFACSPGRLNMRRVQGTVVISDYGHNADGFAKVTRFLNSLDTPGRRLFMFSTVGTRNDAYYNDVMNQVAPHFDHFILAENVRPNSRPAGEVVHRLREGLKAAGVEAARIEMAPSEQDGVRMVLDQAARGDLVYISTARHAETWEKVTAYAPSD